MLYLLPGGEVLLAQSLRIALYFLAQRLVFLAQSVGVELNLLAQRLVFLAQSLDVALYLLAQRLVFHAQSVGVELNLLAQGVGVAPHLLTEALLYSVYLVIQVVGPVFGSVIQAPYCTINPVYVSVDQFQLAVYSVQATRHGGLLPIEAHQPGPERRGARDHKRHQSGVHCQNRCYQSIHNPDL